MNNEKPPIKGYILLAVIIICFIVIGVLVFVMLNKPSSEQQFVGSKNSDVYHIPSCGYAGRIKSENKIWFSSSQDARNHGYRPCKVCKPP